MIHRSKILFDQATTLEKAGQWKSAISVLETIYENSWKARDVGALTEAVLRLGYSYNDDGNTALAIEYLELAECIATLRGDHGMASRAVNGRAIIHYEGGEINEADAEYQRARTLASRAGDTLTVGNISQNLGIVANIRGNFEEAFTYYRHGLKCYEEVGHERGIARVLNNLGMLHIDSGDFEEAEQALDNALAICRKVRDVATENIVHCNRTELFIEQDRLEEARASCDLSFEMASRIDDNRVKAESLKFSGIIYKRSGKPHLSEIHLRQAISIASSYNNPLGEAESLRELALVLREQERNREAFDALNAAHVLFSTLQAKQDQADIDRRFRQLENDFLSVVRKWSESIEQKDRYTQGHCDRVAEYACMIAEKAGLSKSDLVWFRMGAFLHDVGKMETPAEILNKPGRLTDEERRIIERHPVAGDELLASTEFPWDIRPMVRWHHERWDGGGYPDGLREEEIPLSARILRIADVFDALTTTRSYRQPMSAERAFEIMKNDYGSFDPELFEIFVELFPRFKTVISETPALDVGAG